MSAGLLGFYRNCFKEAFTKSWNLAEKVGTVIAFAIPLVISICRNYLPDNIFPKNMEAVMNDLIWQAPLVIFASIGLIRFLLAPYIIFRDEHERTVDLERALITEKDNKLPILAAEFEVLAVAPAGKDDCDSIIIITATIFNTGAPSIVSNFGVEIQRGGKESVKGENVILPPGPMRMEGEGLELTTNEQDNLPRKGISNPILRGGAVTGWHVVLAKNITQSEIHNKETTVVLSYKDVTGKGYTVEKKMDYAISKLIDGTKLQRKK